MQSKNQGLKQICNRALDGIFLKLVDGIIGKFRSSRFGKPAALEEAYEN